MATRQRFYVPPPRSAGPPPGIGIGRTRHEMDYSGVPPVGEVRFATNEVVVQVANSVPRAQVEAVARQLGIAVVATHGFEGAGRIMYQFRSSGGRDVRDVIRRLEQNRIVAAAQPNYVYRLGQSAPSATPAPPLWMQGPQAPQWTPSATPAPPAAAPPDAAQPAAAQPRVPKASLPPPGTRPATAPVGPPVAASGAAGASRAPTSGEASPADPPRSPLPAGDPTQYAVAKLHLADVHRHARGRDVTVAVIDSDIDERHPDLQGAIAERFDPSGRPRRPHTHGTGMAGAIVAKSHLLGVAPEASIVAIKAFDDRSTGAEATSFQILRGLDYAVKRGVRIINMSFAGPYDVMIERKLREAYDKGIVLVAAAGNAGPKSPPLYPAADANVIAVTATDHSDRPFAMAVRGNHVAIAAPGVDILVPSPGGTYQLTTGTSVAAAHVSGVIALILEKRPDLTPEDVRAILAGSSQAIAAAPENTIGAGLIDPRRALTYEPQVDAAPAAADAKLAPGAAAKR